MCKANSFSALPVRPDQISKSTSSL